MFGSLKAEATKEFSWMAALSFNCLSLMYCSFDIRFYFTATGFWEIRIPIADYPDVI